MNRVVCTVMPITQMSKYSLSPIPPTTSISLCTNVGPAAAGGRESDGDEGGVDSDQDDEDDDGECDEADDAEADEDGVGGER